MIDIHCHILPKLDDGAANLQESVAMARTALACGTTQIIATPHFPGREETISMLGHLFGRLEALNAALTREGIPVTIHPGAEILCLPTTPGMAKRKLLPTLGSTNYLLCEFYFNESPVYMDEMLATLSGQGYRIVVAHPERYEAIGANPALAEKWFRMGYVLQMNKGSITGAFGSAIQRTAMELLRRGLYHVVATDGHGARRRTTDMGLAREMLSERCPEEYVHILLEENPGRILRGLAMVPSTPEAAGD